MSDPYVNPYRDGAKAYHQYDERWDNPYRENSLDWLSWNVGFSDAKNGYVDEYGFPNATER